MSNYKKPSAGEVRYAKKICWLFLLLMGFVGWIENHEPAPQLNYDQIAVCARTAAK